MRERDEHAALLVRSACSRNPRRARRLLARDPELARHDLACACAAGEPQEVERRLAAQPALANAQLPPLDREPILYACYSRLLRAMPERAPAIRDVVKLLLEAGADPNASFDHDGWLQVPLYGAAGIANDTPLTQMLVDAGADPNDAGDAHTVGEALYHAVEFPDPACAALLIDAGTEPRVVDYCLGRALNFDNEAMIATLCAHGAKASAGNLEQAVSRRRSRETARLLLDAGAPVDEPDDDGLTPLRLATRWGARELIVLLQQRGADPARVTAADRALGAALSGEREPASSPGDALPSAGDAPTSAGDAPTSAGDALPSAGDASTSAGDAPPSPGDARSDAAGPSSSNGELDTPLGALAGVEEMLLVAVQAGDLDAVRQLLDLGAPVEGDPASEHTLLGEAAWRGHPQIVRELIRSGASLVWSDGSPIGAALHGSRHCHDPEGGPTMRTVQEIPKLPYREVVEALLDAGATVPAKLADSSFDPVKLLRALGLAPSN